MQDSIDETVHQMVNDARKSFETRGWWDSPRRTDRARRRHVESVLSEILLHHGEFIRGLESVRRILARLQAGTETGRHVMGFAVSFKKPGSGKLRWADVHGASNPLEASSIAAAREDVQALLEAGYREYGISALVEWRPKALMSSKEEETPPSPRLGA